MQSQGGAPHRILVVDDDPDIRDLIELVLTGPGREVETAETGADAVDAVRASPPDLVTLDLTLPDADGIEVCRSIREFSDAYIVMITGRAEQAQRLAGLDVGADEYLAKPFDPAELRARVAVLLQRPRLGLESPPTVDDDVLRDLGGGLVLDTRARTAILHGTQVPLTATEYDVLAALAAHAGATVRRAELAAEVYQGRAIESDFGVDVHVGSVRRKLRRAAAGHDWVRTVAGDGYVLRAPDQAGP